MPMPEFYEQSIEEFLFGPCSMSLLEELSSENDYWESVKDFYDSNSEKIMGNLSPKQRAWILRIKEDLLDKA